MASGGLHQHDAAFAERDSFLHAVIGLVSWGERFARLVARFDQHSPEGVAAPATREVYAVLGVISVWRRAQQELTAWATERPAAPSEHSPSRSQIAFTRELSR